MFDRYEPAGTLRCSVDGNPLADWQGKDGPCLLFVWREGERHPVSHWVDEESRYSAAKLQGVTLPPEFGIYSYDCPRHHPITASCATIDGVWRVTRLNPIAGFDEYLASENSWRPTAGATERKAPPPREFILIDLTSQMPYLPAYARDWPRERLLAWLRVWGEVCQTEARHATLGEDWFTFRSWVGRWTFFALSSDGRMYIPGTCIRAWEGHAP